MLKNSLSVVLPNGGWLPSRNLKVDRKKCDRLNEPIQVAQEHNLSNKILSLFYYYLLGIHFLLQNEIAS